MLSRHGIPAVWLGSADEPAESPADDPAEAGEVPDLTAGVARAALNLRLAWIGADRDPGATPAARPDDRPE